MRLIDADALKISLKEPIEMSEERAKALWEGWHECTIAVDRAIDDAPTIDSQPHWIPCSKRLPDKPNMYTVTDHNGKVVRYVFYDNESSREYWRRCAKAWMPLPAPYQEGADNE